MASVAKTAANRKNALKSTGPKTDHGKTKSKLNAVAHGIYAKSQVLPGEDESAYRELEKSLREHFRPVGPVENILVREIIREAWRLLRFERAENALFKHLRESQLVRYLRPLTCDEMVYVDSECETDRDDHIRQRIEQIKADKRGDASDSYVAECSKPEDLGEDLRVGPDKDRKRVIDTELARVLDPDSTILAGLVPKSEGAPQACLDRERRATMRAYCSLVDKLMKLQAERSTVTVMPVPSVSEVMSPISATEVKSLPPEQAVKQEA